MLEARFPLASVVTVRHPIESFASLRKNGWVHFRPDTLEAYCTRYLAFLDAYRTVPVVLYEDFVAEPEATMAAICRHLELRYNPDFLDVFSALYLSGDSGRGGDVIRPRTRREIPPALSQEAHESAAYAVLCRRLGYEPVTRG